MLILEAARQASIATAHLMGLPSDGMITPVNYASRFLGFATKGIPLTVRSFMLFSGERSAHEKEGICVCNLFQWGRQIAEIAIAAHGFTHPPAYERQRKRTARIAERSRRRYHEALLSLTGKEDQR